MTKWALDNYGFTQSWLIIAYLINHVFPKNRVLTENIQYSVQSRSNSGYFNTITWRIGNYLKISAEPFEH